MATGPVFVYYFLLLSPPQPKKFHQNKKGLAKNDSLARFILVAMIKPKQYVPEINARFALYCLNAFIYVG